MLEGQIVLKPETADGTGKGALPDGREAVVFDAAAPQGAEARWKLDADLEPGWHRVGIRFTGGAPGNRKLLSLDFIGEDGKAALLSIDLYNAPDKAPDGGPAVVGVYLPQKASSVAVKKNQRRAAPSTPILDLSLAPGRPDSRAFFMESALIPVSGGEGALPPDFGGGSMRAILGKSVGLKWTQSDGKSFATVPGSSVCVYVRGGLSSLSAQGVESVMLERRPEGSSPVDSNYLNRPLLPLAGPATQSLEIIVEGTDLDAAGVALADFPNGARMAAVQSWDDGIESDLRASQLMAKHGWRASFFFNKHSRMLDRWKELEDLGMEVGSHSWSHPAYWLQTPRRCWEESVGCRALLEEKTGHPIIAFAYPFNYGGAFDAEGDYVLRANREAGYLSCRATSTGRTTLDDMGEPLNYKSDGHFQMPRANLEAAWSRASNAQRGVFYIWGHTYEMAKEADWSAYEETLATFGHRREAWYASQGDLSVWKWMRGNVKITASGSASRLTVKIERPKLHPWWAARIPVALRVPGSVASASASGASVSVMGGVVQADWR